MTVDDMKHRNRLERMKLAYLTTCFGTPSHTFIRRELREMAARGLHVELYGIRQDTNIADDAHDLMERTRYAYPLNIANLISSVLKFAIFRPHRFWPCFLDGLLSKDDNLKARLKLVYHLVICTPLASDIEKKGITHLHAHFLHVPSSVSMFMARLTSIPFSITLHSAGEQVLPNVNAIALKLKHASKLLMISQYNIDHYSEIYPCQEKSHVVRCGIDIESFEPRPFQTPDNNAESGLTLLAVGRFVDKKGFQVLLQAAKILVARGFKFSLEILGNGPLHETCQAYVHEHALSDFVSLPGLASTDTVKAKMRAADAVIVPSTTGPNGEMEGIPVVLMESMASNIPVIATKHSGIPELVHSETGSLVNENNAEELADAIFNFSPSKEKIGAAKKLIDEQFNIHTIVTQRLSIFQD